MKAFYASFFFSFTIFFVQAQSLQFQVQDGLESVTYDIDGVSPAYMPRLNNTLTKPLDFDALIVNPTATPFTEVFLATYVFDSSNNLVATYYSDTVPNIPGDSTTTFIFSTDGVMFWSSSTNGDFRIETEIFGKNAGTQVSQVSSRIHELHFGNHIGGDFNQVHNLLHVVLSSDTVTRIAIQFGIEGANSLEGFSLLVGDGSASCTELTAKLYPASAFIDGTVGFSGPPSVMRTYAVNNGIMLEQRDSGKFMYYDLDVPNFTFSGVSQSVFLVVEINTKNGTCPLSFGNDTTYPMRSNLAMFYTSGQARWFNAFVNSKRFNCPLLRMHLDGFTPMVSLQENVKESRDFVLYPNPTNNNLKIDLNEFAYMENLQLIIHDLSGKKILENSDAQDLMELDISKLSKGTYQTTLTSSGRVIKSKLLVKQ